ncbi:MAG: phosphate acyltransferase PlsX [Gemmatimonadales bacterium]|nr:MAG: phosphate acyltransferase PlsX [Gemmatimonadales bacterium]
MRIALDAQGTDRAPQPEIEGVLSALASWSGPRPDIVLVGDRAVLEPALLEVEDRPGAEHLEIVHAPDRIDPGEAPVTAVRRRNASSIVAGIRLQKEGAVDAFISAGSTGAVMAGSLIHLRPLPGVDRPAIGTLLPTAAGPTLMLDAGANVDCRARHLEQFAHLGHIYAQDLMGLDRPRIGLLNIGEEPEKGDELALAAHARLAASPSIHFVGNVEGRDIISGACDVLVCDGFVGNVLLKFYESVAEFIVGLLRKEVAETGSEIDVRGAFRVLDYAEYGGAPLLGVNGVTIICHGSSTSRAIENAVGVAARAVAKGMVGHIARQLPGLSGEAPGDGATS